MRRFHSYGPVDAKKHFVAPRKALIESCVRFLVGDIEEGGHFFTIWAPRQTGKTWLMQQAMQSISAEYKDRFALQRLSFGGLRGAALEPDAQRTGRTVPVALEKLLAKNLPGAVGPIQDWQDFIGLFTREAGLWDQPLILLIDEVDTLHPELLDMMVAQFREIYLDRNRYLLHGLGLAGVRAVLGVESRRGSPFNIQRSLRVPNFSREEVEDLFCQYEAESGQIVDPGIIERLYAATRGQPGLVCWFGEMMTETYNPGADLPIDLPLWEEIYDAAIHREWNNTVLNLIKKAKRPYLNHVVELFSRSNIPFNIQSDWCSFLYLNGIIEEERIPAATRGKKYICRFSSPFVQEALYNALTLDIVGEVLPIPPLDPLDDLADVFAEPELDLLALLARYKDYLKRLKARGLNPWKDQPRRADLHLTEAVGHFHLYSWLLNAIGRRCSVSPEFPTGNGKVDLHLRCEGKKGLIEVKSFIDIHEAKRSKKQAAAYALQMGLKCVTLAMFVPTDDDTVLEKLSGSETIDGVGVNTTAIGWT